jgi:hypothetical protein
MKLPNIYVIITKREYNRLCKLIHSKELCKEDIEIPFSSDLLPQLTINGIQFFTNKQIRGM